MVLGLGAVGTMAAWSTSATTTSGEFTTGTIDIRLNGDQGATTQTAYTLFAAGTTIPPGGSVAVLLPVQNTGTATFDYTAKAIGDDALGRALQLTARYSGATVVNNACSGGTAIPTAAVSLASERSIGGVRRLAATTGTEVICLQFTLPLTTTGVATGQSGSVLFTFTATSDLA
jgi:predicted ribosomally synthesized peptide with SipW-like signal peptide